MSMEPPVYPETEAERLCRLPSADAPSFNPGHQRSACVVVSSDQDLDQDQDLHQDQDHVGRGLRVIDPPRSARSKKSVKRKSSTDLPIILSTYSLICPSAYHLIHLYAYLPFH